MFLQIQAKKPITIHGSAHYPGGTYNTGDWVNILPYSAYGTMDATTNSVDGPNAGRSIDNGYMIRDLLGYKNKVPFVSYPISLEDCQALRQLVMEEELAVRTDIFEGAMTTYDMYPGATVTITHVQSYTDGSVMGKISFNLIEL